MSTTKSLPQKIAGKIQAKIKILRSVVHCSKISSGLYYFFFDRSYDREQISVLKGIKKNKEQTRRPTGNIATLRRNIHRIEKGLIMRPRRDIFAKDYIIETCLAYRQAVSGQMAGKDEMQWAHDVLREYFAAVKEEKEVIKAKEIFEKEAAQTCCETEVKLIPYQRNFENKPFVSYEDLHALSIHRRSVRWFKQEPVPREVIDKAISLGAQAPSACNRQPFQFRIFDDHDLVQKVVRIPFGLHGYGHNVPCLAVVVGDQSSFFDERDRHLIYIDASLAIMGTLFAFESLGVSTCCVNWPAIESQEKEMAKLLGLEVYERPIMLIAIGYPDPQGLVARSTKKPIEALRKYNFE